MKLQLLTFVLFLLITTQTKFWQKCSTFTSCSGCVLNDCGWCYATNKCLSGTDIGPYFDNCPFQQWETTKCNYEFYSINQPINSGLPNNDIDWDLALAQINQHFVKNRLFNSQFKTWLNSGIKPFKYSLFNSWSNPKGIFQSQILMNKTDTMPMFNFVGNRTDHEAFFESLSKQIPHFLDIFAYENLKTLFENKLNSNGDIAFALANATKYIDNYDYYAWWVSLVPRKWDNYLRFTYPSVTNETIYNLFNHEMRDNEYASDNTTNTLINGTSYVNYPNSLLYIVRYSYDMIQLSGDTSFETFPYNKIELKSHCDQTTVLVFQKINLIGQGNQFTLIPFKNGIKSESEKIVHNSMVNFDSVDIDHIDIAQITKSGDMYKYHSWYQSNVHLQAKNKSSFVNNIIIEFPNYTSEIITKKTLFANADDLASLTTFLNVKDQTNVEFEEHRHKIGSLSRNNYIIVIKSSNNNNNKFFLGLEISHVVDSTDIIYHASLNMNAIALSNNNIANVISISFVSWDIGYNKIKPTFETIKTSAMVGEENVEMKIMKWPDHSQVLNSNYKSTFTFKQTSEYVRVDGLRIKMQITSKKHIIISSKAILTGDQDRNDITFHVFYNGKDIQDTKMECRLSAQENECAVNSITNQVLSPGKYEYEWRYISDKAGVIELGDNKWDVLGISIWALDR